MGADFVYSWVALDKPIETTKRIIFEEIDKFSIPELSDNPKDKIISSLKNKTSENFNLFCEFYEGLSGDFNEGGLPVEEIEDEKDGEIGDKKIIVEKRAKEIFREVVINFFDCLENRDVGSFDFKGSTIYLSGGMSLGDAPTSSFDIINSFTKFPRKILAKAGVS